jgi:uncharacterized protein (TIGR02452 family)
MIKIISKEQALESILYFSKLTDIQDWQVDNLTRKNSLNTEDLSTVQTSLAALELNQRTFLLATQKFPKDCLEDSEHMKTKFERLRNKLITLQSSGTRITHQQFTSAIRNNVPPSITLSNGPSSTIVPSLNTKILGAGKPLSFSIENNPMSQPMLSSLQILERISYSLRNGNEQQALDEFSSLPHSIQQKVYEALWFVRGKPTEGNPIAHSNFGEVSFKNLEKRCSSSPQEKACAIELAKIPAALLEIADAFENKKDQALANQIFSHLPSQIQNEIFGKHWHEMGKPTNDHPDESLRKIAHADFGKVSFLGTEQRCDVSLDKKAHTVKAYLADYRSKIDVLQNTIQKTQAEWTETDKSSVPGSKKNGKKKESLNNLAQSIVPQFVDKVSVTQPNPKGDSFQALTAAYVEAYPVLRPFFSQLVPDLKLANEGFPQGQIRKPSQVSIPNLNSMSHQDRKAYRKAIMDETLDTLNKGFYINSKGQKVTLNFQPAVNSLQCISTSAKPEVRKGQYQTHIFLDKKDCLTVTHDCVNRGLNPITADAASDDHFGGGYKTGAGAQEENVCRRSALPTGVDPALGIQSQNYYPLSAQGTGNRAILYISHVPVFRDEEEKGYPYLDHPFETAVGILAAFNFNEKSQKKLKIDPLTNEPRIPDEEAYITKAKLRNFFEIAQTQGHDAVVIVPLGCGAFANPPKHMCEIMMELIGEEFPNSFKEIHIAIVDDHNTGKTHNPRGNYIEFKETIENFWKNQTLMANSGATFTVST